MELLRALVDRHRRLLPPQLHALDREVDSYIDPRIELPEPELFVAPVLEPGGRVEVYVPEGEWVGHFTGESVTGPRWMHHEAVPLDRIPVLVRAGTHPITPEDTEVKDHAPLLTLESGC